MEKSYKRFSFIILQQDSIKARLIMGLYETFRIAIALDVFAQKIRNHGFLAKVIQSVTKERRWINRLPTFVSL